MPTITPPPRRDVCPFRRTLAARVGAKWGGGIGLLLVLVCVFDRVTAAPGHSPEIEQRFLSEVRPFLQQYCLDCHGRETHKADLDLSPFTTFEAVRQDHPRWEMVLNRLREGDMPPPKAKIHPAAGERAGVVAWIEAMRAAEALRHAGDPGPVPARRLSHAEFDATVRDLTGVDLRPTRSFPIDPANQAGFDNSAESLAMSPALVKKYLQAARDVADHLVLLPHGFTFAPHPVVAETDRDKWAVFRIVDFYRRQPTDYADYFLAAWRYQHRAALGRPGLSLAETAVSSGLSPKYLAVIWDTLTATSEEVGPIAKWQRLWRALPPPSAANESDVADRCESIRDELMHLRAQIIPEVKNLTAPPIQEGSQTLVLWKNRQMAANRRRFDPAALRVQGKVAARTIATSSPAAPVVPQTNAPARRRNGRVQAPIPEIVKTGGVSLAPILLTTGSSATTQLAGRRQELNADLLVPSDPIEQWRYEDAFARFAHIFPDAFYITERARVYLDATKEQENAGRLLSAGLHSMTGYFRDDQPLYDLVLDEVGQREIDRLWDEFDFVASVPQRMHVSLLWFERTDSAYLRDPEFDPYRPEDRSVTSPEKLQSLAELYLAKARRHHVSETAEAAIEEHFRWVTANIARVERQRRAAEPSHWHALETWAARAYRRPLSQAEREALRAFYEVSRRENGVEHEEAMRDAIVRILMSPHFLFRMDLVEASVATPSSAAGAQAPTASSERGAESAGARAPLSQSATASRLSYFLWSSMPDETLLARAAAGELHQPEVLRREVRRMLRDERVRAFATEFAGQWLEFRRFEQHNSVDRTQFPSFNPALRQAMFEEPVRFFTDLIQRDRSVLDCLYARDTFVNAPLAAHYGASIPPLASADTWVHLEDARALGRGGLLPMAVFLTANSPGLRTSPVKRGNWLVKRILGERIPPPPATVPELPGNEKQLGDLTLREVLARHRENDACSGCHERFDAYGLVFEAYGPIGERRDRDLGGRPVDARADFPGGGEGVGLAGLVEHLRARRQGEFVEHLCRTMLAYGLGRSLILSDEPLVRTMREALVADGYRFSRMIESIVTSPQFLQKRSHALMVNR